MNTSLPEWRINLPERRVEEECLLADVLKLVEFAILAEEACAFSPVQSASSALNRALEAVLNVLALFVHDGSDERRMDDWSVADAGQEETASSIGDFDLIRTELVCIG